MTPHCEFLERVERYAGAAILDVYDAHDMVICKGARSFLKD